MSKVKVHKSIIRNQEIPDKHHDIGSIDFVRAEFCTVTGIFTESRIPREQISRLPSFIHCYGIRHDDRGYPCTIEQNVAVNRFGTFLTTDNNLQPFMNSSVLFDNFIPINDDEDDYCIDWDTIINPTIWIVEETIKVISHQIKKYECIPNESAANSISTLLEDEKILDTLNQFGNMFNMTGSWAMNRTVGSDNK
jgi:hypothetical protein